jgi:hypothetical protein
MNIKGTAYLTRKDTIIKTFGEERWNAFSAKLAAKDKYFSQTIMNITLIPLDKFIINVNISLVSPISIVFLKTHLFLKKIRDRY